MIEKIDLFLPPRSQYQVLQAFTISLSEALKRTGITTRVLEAKKDRPQEFVETLLSDPPDCTLSFNGLLPDDEGRFFCDLVKIPHVACLVDAPQHFISLIKSPRSIITCVDLFACDFFEGLNFHNALFMPHGVDRNLIINLEQAQERPYDVIMLASFIDYEAVEQRWKKNPQLGEIWLEAAQQILEDRELSIAQAIAKAMDHHLKNLKNIDPAEIDFLMVMDDIEDYVNGKDRVELLKALKGVTVHLFGAGTDRWKKCLGPDATHVILHGPISFQQAIKLMRQSKIVLNSRPVVKNGAHERIFLGLASGAAVITNENIYMHNHFKNHESILFYQNGHWDQLNEVIQEYLKNEPKRLALVQKGQELVRDGHTWDHRAAVLVNELEPILSHMG